MLTSSELRVTGRKDFVLRYPTTQKIIFTTRYETPRAEAWQGYIDRRVTGWLPVSAFSS